MRPRDGKQAHQRQGDAASHLRELVAAGGAPSPVVRHYHCRHYGAWHSTIGTSLAASISTHSTETMTLRVTPFLPKYLFDSTATTAAPSELW